MEQGLTPLGTMAHEYLQACQAVGPRLRDSQVVRVQHVGARVSRRPRDRAVRRRAAWMPSCATSTSSSASCSTACATIRATRSSGARSSSRTTRGCASTRAPRRWCSPTASTFRSPSGSTSTSRAAAQTSFGIGTNLTNDLGYEPLQIVIKMTRCNGQPVAKISDEPSKTMDYDPSYVQYLREVFQVPEPAPPRPA